MVELLKAFGLATQLRFVFMLALFILPPMLIMWVIKDYTPRLIQGGIF